MKEYYTVEDAAQLLKCSTRRIYYLVQRQRLTPADRRPLIFTHAELQRYATDPKRLKALNHQRRPNAITSKRRRDSLNHNY